MIAIFRYLLILLLATIPSAKLAGAEPSSDCSAGWIPFLDIDATKPKYLSGDTLAAYGLYMFKMNRRNAVDLVLEGLPYDARFWSIETYLGRTQIKTDHLLDRDVRLDSDGKYRVRLSARNPQGLFSNEMRIDPPRILNQVYSIMVRIYLPERELTPADLPRMRAIDPVTGRPAQCPDRHAPLEVDLPQGLMDLRDPERHSTITFGKQPAWFDLFGLGGNSAVPDYRQAMVRMDRPDDVAVIRFKAPTFGWSENADTRYWSLCVQNFLRNTTLACLPDDRARVDADGFVTLIFARFDEHLVRLADHLGYNFIEDQRPGDSAGRRQQLVVGFVYRNLLPTEHFLPDMYQGPFEPKGRVCSSREFISQQTHAAFCR